MAAKDSKTICDEISAYITKQNGPRKSWYVGIAASIEQRLRGDHNVPQDSSWWIWREAISAEEARSVEKAFLDWGCDGGPGGGDHTTKFVYAYLKTSTTRE